MGNCGGICNLNILKLKGDIILNSKERKSGHFLEQNNINKIIYLQKQIRKFLQKIKLKKQLKMMNILNSHSNQKSKYQNEIVNLTKDSPNKSNKNIKSSKKSNNKYITYEEEPTTELLIPTVNTPLMEKNIFNDDPFRKKHNKKYNNKNDNLNDPRNGPIDGVRRRFPKIKEGNSSYEGEWKDGKRDGYGILCWGDESKFMGKFEDDKVIGYGKLWHNDGDIYRGYWREFQADGIGIYTNKKGSFFKGEWQHDRQNGFGIEKWPKGSNFYGEYYDGNKNGIGILNFGNKASYKGEFKNGIICGIGTFYFEDRRRYEGQWKNNKMHGFGIIVWPGGDVFEGEFYEDKKCGFGVFYNKNKIYMGNWKNNKPEGDVVIIDGDKIKRQFWENGRPVRYLEEGYKTAFEKYIDIALKEQKIKCKKNA